MGVENLEAFEKEAQSPGDGGQSAGNGRSKGNALKIILTIGKQVLDLPREDASCLQIGGVEPEVVREDQASWLQHTKHICTNIFAEFGVEN